MYRYKWISYPVYSYYNSGIFRERCGVECNIIGTVKVMLQYDTLMYIINDSHPAKATEYRNSLRIRNEYGTTP
jgi:hypothetical protein